MSMTAPATRPRHPKVLSPLSLPGSSGWTVHHVCAKDVLVALADSVAGMEETPVAMSVKQ